MVASPVPSKDARPEALFALATEAFSAGPLDRFFDFFCVTIGEVVPFQRAILATFEDGREPAFTIRQEFFRGTGDETSWLRNLPATTPAANTCMSAVTRTGKPCAMPSLSNSDYADLQSMRRLGFDSCLMIPLAAAGRSAGILVLLAARDNGFAHVDQAFLLDAVKPLATSLHHALLQESLARVTLRLEQSENTDWLTGLFTRRYFVQAVENELSRASRFSQAFSLLFVDADRFRDVNARFGHSGGDKALKHLASVLKRTVRPFDIVSRYGGEEFAILLPQTGREGATATALRLCGEIRSSPAPLGINSVTVTVSIGVAAYPDDGNNLETVMQQADRAMYSAKSRGGNTIAPAEQIR